MIPAVAQTLAEFLNSRLSHIEAEQISFEHPSYFQGNNLGINLYFYDIQVSAERSPFEDWPPVEQLDSARVQTRDHSASFDVSFMLTVKGNTRLGEQHLLSEVFLLLSQCHYLPRSSKAPTLKGSAELSIKLNHASDPTQFWCALQTPMHPALHIIVTVPSETFEKRLSSCELACCLQNQP